ncbi:MAG: hypothetical protein U0353_34010 [Sandaracinus sp.]
MTRSCPRALCQSGGTLASSAAAASMHEVRGTLPVGHAPHMDDTSFRVAHESTHRTGKSQG